MYAHMDAADMMAITMLALSQNGIRRNRVAHFAALSYSSIDTCESSICHRIAALDEVGTAIPADAQRRQEQVILS
jgi:hypothetical protein